ncbi:Uncharacterised protein [Segatella copri]|nr:Uncharacterised protein [Segatella copri]
MPWSEDDRNQFTIVCLQRKDEIGNLLEPSVELLLLGASIQDSSYGITFRIPGILASNRIPRMPTQSNDASSLILGNDFFSHTIERYAIEVFLAVEL